MIIHGYNSQRNEAQLLDLHTQAKKYQHVSLYGASNIPPFGTHHSKMMLLFYDKGLLGIPMGLVHACTPSDTVLPELISSASSF